MIRTFSHILANWIKTIATAINFEMFFDCAEDIIIRFCDKSSSFYLI